MSNIALLNLQDVEFASLYKRRYIYKNFVSKITSSKTKITALCGLRRTGKSIMMMQALTDLSSKGMKCSYIECNNATLYQDIEQHLQKCYEESYDVVFIDEITFCKDFLQCASILADVWQKRLCIVIAGTHSLVISLAKQDILFDRVNIFDTTYISFKEWSELLNINDLNSYIYYGGTLTWYTYKDIQSVTEYVNTSIVDNVMKAVELAIEGDCYKLSPNIIKASYYEIKYCIYKWISVYSRDISYKSLKKVIGADILKRNYSNLTVKDMIDIDLISNALLVDLSVPIVKVTEQLLEDTKRLLYDLGLLQIVGNSKESTSIFTNAGLQFSITQMIIDYISNPRYWKIELTTEELNNIINRVSLNAQGEILENIILLDTYKSLSLSRQDRFGKVKFNNSEIDMIYLNHKEKVGYLYEIKRSSEYNKSQCVHLNNEEFIAYIMHELDSLDRVEKHVIYNGNNFVIDDIEYINSVSYLQSLKFNSDSNGLFKLKLSSGIN